MKSAAATTENFDKKVLQADKPVIVDFWAEWCGPCRMIAPFLEDIAAEMAGKVQIVKVNIDENPDLAARYGVRSIPTLLMFKHGKIADTMIGAAPKSRLSDWAKKAL